MGTLPALGCDIMDSLRTATEQTQEAFLLQEGYGSQASKPSRRRAGISGAE